MEWMEIIRVQTAGRETTELCRNCLSAFKPIGVPHLANIRHLDNAAIDGWHILIIEWDSQITQCNGSRAGQAIVKELGRFGMVDHSVWVGSKTTQKKTRRHHLPVR